MAVDQSPGALAAAAAAASPEGSEQSLQKALSLIASGQADAATPQQAAALAASLTPEQLEQLQSQVQEGAQPVPPEATPQPA